MGELSLCLRARRPRLFLIFCCLFSVALGAMSSIFFYYPEGVNLPPVFSPDGLVMDPHQQSHHHQTDRAEYLSSGHHHLRSSSSSSVKGGNKLTPMHFDSVMNDQEDYTEKIRHLGHHFGGEDNTMMEVEEEVTLVPMGDLEERSVISNVIESRLIHFDLKGAPPKVSYLKEVLRLAKSSGINGVLIEWEDTFPWRDNLENLTLVRGGYSMSEVEEIVSYAEKSLGMEVIPLIQTFGHVEFILKGEKFRHLREVMEDPQSYCPSKSGTMEVISEMIDQVLEVHKNAKYVHIGCDEVYNLHMCSLCQSAFEYRDDVFLTHVTRVAELVRKKEKIPIIWDDMLRSIPAQRLTDSGIGSLVEPMVWVYAEDIDRFVGWESWEKYSKIFSTIWAAAAFKGAFGETLTIPPITRHAENSQRWVDVLARESVRWGKGVGGLVLTGWQRYDHFAVLCELLPAAIPSLVYTSLIISTPNSGHAIRNRVFSPKDEIMAEPPPPEDSSSTSTSTTTTTTTTSEDNKPMDLSTPVPSEFSSEFPDTLLSRAERSTRRRIPHPRSLMQKETGMARFGNHHGARFDGRTQMMPYHIQFHRVLRCANHADSLAVSAKDLSDTEWSFASRCNFPGVAFFRTLFRLRALMKEIWELESRILRGRAWATPYNVRHNYSLPSRVDEVIFSQVPRYRRQLSTLAKSIAISLKTIYRGEVVLEWLEQNVWEAWQVLDSFEKVGDRLKRTNIWPRRPLRSPPDMVRELGLQAVNLLEHEEL